MIRALLQPHRLGLLALALALVVWAGMTLRWDWIPRYWELGLAGLWRTLWLLQRRGRAVLGERSARTVRYAVDHESRLDR